MNYFNDYIIVLYVEGGRIMKGLDCWGLICLVFYYIYNLLFFIFFGYVCFEYKVEFIGVYLFLVEKFEVCVVKLGVVICGFIGINFVYMGVCVDVDGENYVLYICKKYGVLFVRVSVFKRFFSEVEVYEYVG